MLLADSESREALVREDLPWSPVGPGCTTALPLDFDAFFLVSGVSVGSSAGFLPLVGGLGVPWLAPAFVFGLPELAGAVSGGLAIFEGFLAAAVVEPTFGAFLLPVGFLAIVELW